MVIITRRRYESSAEAFCLHTGILYANMGQVELNQNNNNKKSVFSLYEKGGRSCVCLFRRWTRASVTESCASVCARGVNTKHMYNYHLLLCNLWFFSLHSKRPRILFTWPIIWCSLGKWHSKGSIYATTKRSLVYVREEMVCIRWMAKWEEVFVQSSNDLFHKWISAYGIRKWPIMGSFVHTLFEPLWS